MKMKIGFDPDNLKPEDEAYPAFQKGGMTLKVWALYKHTFITSQHFRECLELFAAKWDDIHDRDKILDVPYKTLDEFMMILQECKFIGHVFGPSYDELSKWAAKYWPYLSFNLQSSLTLEFDRVMPVRCSILVN